MAFGRIIKSGVKGGVLGGVIATGVISIKETVNDSWCDYVTKNIDQYPSCGLAIKGCGYSCSNPAEFDRLDKDAEAASKVFFSTLKFWVPVSVGIGILAGIAYGSYRELKTTYRNLNELQLPFFEREALEEKRVAELRSELKDTFANSLKEIASEHPDYKINVKYEITPKENNLYPNINQNITNPPSAPSVSQERNTLFYPNLNDPNFGIENNNNNFQRLPNSPK